MGQSKHKNWAVTKYNSRSDQLQSTTVEVTNHKVQQCVMGLVGRPSDKTELTETKDQYNCPTTIFLYRDERETGLSMTKPTKWHVRPAKTQISLGFHPVWSEYSLSAWRKLRSLATHVAYREDSDAQAALSRHWAHISFCWLSHDVAQMHDIKFFQRRNKP